MPETSISISEATRRQLHELAEWSGGSVAAAPERAGQEQYDRQFRAAVNAGYAALRVDPGAWAEVDAERRRWDATLMDGLGPSERRTEGGKVVPSSPNEEHSPCPSRSTRR
jgi:hypothetical protein